MSTANAGVAILGAGIFATEAYLPAFASLGADALPLRAVYSRSSKSAQLLTEVASRDLGLTPDIYHDSDPAKNLDALLAREDITAVIIALPITHQPTVILAALIAGKHVLSEKPIGADVRRGQDLIQTYRSTYLPKGLVWRVAENFEAEPVFRTAAAIIKAEEIGKINFFRANVFNHVTTDSKWYKTPWRTVPEYQGGFLLDGGVHTIAALRTILPHPLTHLSGFASLNKEYLKPHDTIHAIVKAGDAFHGIVEMTFAAPLKSRPSSDDFVVVGDKGWLSINLYSKSGNAGEHIHQIKVKVIVEEEGKPPVETERVIDEVGKGVAVEVKSFYDAIAGKDALTIGDPSGALSDVGFIQAALNSGGELVDLRKLVE